MGNSWWRGLWGNSGRKERKANLFALDGSRPFNSKVLDLEAYRSVQKGENLRDKYSLGPELGRGCTAITYLCTDLKTQELLACKSIAKRKLRWMADVENVRREVAIMHGLPPHPHIVSLKGVFEDNKAVHLVMELCKGKELFDRIDARGHYDERGAAAIIRSIVQVIQFCHKHEVMHRDIKPENFLFVNEKENSPLKAIDFGGSVYFKPGERFSEILGSPYYMAPELLKGDYGPEVDIWSAGVTLYSLLCGSPPFNGDNDDDIRQAVLRGKLEFNGDPWPKVSDDAKSLVHIMLDQDPKTRPTALQVLHHPWLGNATKTPLEDINLVRANEDASGTIHTWRKRAMHKCQTEPKLGTSKCKLGILKS